MWRKKIFKLIHLSRKAGKMTVGNTSVHAMLEQGKAELIIMAEDYSAGSEKKLFQGIETKVPVIRFSTRAELGREFGRDSLGVISINDKNFATGIMDYFEQGRQEAEEE